MLISQDPSRLVFFENRSHSDWGQSNDEYSYCTKPYSLISLSTIAPSVLLTSAAIENPRECRSTRLSSEPARTHKPDERTQVERQKPMIAVSSQLTCLRRVLNRTRQKGWLAPSLEHRVLTTFKLRCVAPGWGSSC